MTPVRMLCCVSPDGFAFLARLGDVPAAGAQKVAGCLAGQVSGPGFWVWEGIIDEVPAGPPVPGAAIISSVASQVWNGYWRLATARDFAVFGIPLPV